MDASAVSGWQPYPVKSTDLAFLQYTSGSTSAPKGVMISQANLLHNMIALQRATDLQPEDVGVMWLPPFHDMGLVTGLMAPLYAGTVSIFMAPVAFLERPYRWLRAITKYHGTQTVAPNFAYQLCTEKITPEELSQLDLSSLRLVSSAAEPVRLSTMESFRAMMEPRGFDPLPAQPPPLQPWL